MKNLLLLVCFVLVGAMSANAQCSKSKSESCCAKKATSSVDSKDTKVASAVMTADISEAEALANSDENIQKRVDATTGDVSYFQKETCVKSGKVSWSEVSYCDKSKAFTKVASVSMERELEEPAATSTETPVKKACCAGKKACDKKVNN